MNSNLLSMQKCQTYEQSQVDAAIIKLLEPLGGIGAFVKPGHKVLLKPNMLSCKDPGKAATTHPAVVEAVARLCVDAGAQVFIGDSPPSIFGRTEDFWNRTGFAKAADKSGAKLLCFENDDKQPLNFTSNGRRLTAYVTRHCFDVNLVINLPKMKTHNLTRITGAIKNLFGLLPGLAKAQWHKAFPRPLDFSNFIVDLAQHLPCHLNIMDGIEAMDGQGPSGGRVVRPGVLLAAASPVTVDIGFCGVVDLSPAEVPMLVRCRELSWGPASLDQVKMAGTQLAALKFNDYQVPRLVPVSFIPEWLLNLGRKLAWAGPALLPGLCIKCGRCKKICPADAIEIVDNGAAFNTERCISCFCCMEVCPVDAIEMKTSFLLGLIFKIRGLKRKLKNRKQ